MVFSHSLCFWIFLTKLSSYLWSYLSSIGKKNNIPLGNILIKPKYNESHFCIVTYGETGRLIYDNYDKIVEETNATFMLVNLLKLNSIRSKFVLKPKNV